MAKILPHTFFNRPAEVVARELLGCALCVSARGKIERHIITETEAYVGPHDLASHASKGRTARTEVMFQNAGTMYVYLVYGMYEMLNIVTGAEGYPAAVLIRGVGKWNGPGKLTRALGITREQNGRTLGKKAGLWIEDGPKHIASERIICSPRIGVAYAKEWAKEELRFTSPSRIPRPLAVGMNGQKSSNGGAISHASKNFPTEAVYSLDLYSRWS